MQRPYSQTNAAFQRAKKAMPFGVSSNFRYSGEDTMVVKRGEGAYIWDMDDNRYIDYRLAFGPIILGHADPRVNKRVIEAIAGSTIYAHTHMLEVEVAERIIEMCPGVDRVRFANSGTEATMHALRIARAYTNRDKIIKFEGGYHGFHDYMLWSTANSPVGVGGSPNSPVPYAVSSGMPRSNGDLVMLTRFNDFDMIERVMRDRGHEAAAFIMEPALGNVAGVMPLPGYLEHVRKLCDQYGVVMIMDEVKTGFRFARGGAAEYFGVTADLYTYAKSLANGYPLAAIGGKAEIMDTIQPGQVAHGGTYCGNSVGTAAAAATLDILKNTNAMETIHAKGKRLMHGVDDVLTEHGVHHVMTGHPAMFGFVLEPKGEKVTEFRHVANSNGELYETIAAEMMDLGVEYETDPREPWFMCEAHSDKDIDETLNKFNDVVKNVRKTKHVLH
jgi:glutamate-1-semialdehyde 2,1-aminomutase